MPSVIETARWAAAQRARESERADRLFSDPFARALAGDEGMTALQLSEQYNPRHQETASYLAIRIRLFDEVAQRAAAAGIRQVVLLAAGMDARAYRLAWPDGATFYELDHPELLASKEEILRRERMAPKCQRVTLGTDLRHAWAQRLVDAGFVPQQPSIWIIEGLFYYLEPAAVEHVLEEISAIAAPDSVLVTDLISASFLNMPWMKQFLKEMEERGMAWRFGTDDPAGLFGRYGWEAQVLQPEAEGSRFDPQRFTGTNSGRPSGTQGFFVVARRKP